MENQRKRVSQLRLYSWSGHFNSKELIEHLRQGFSTLALLFRVRGKLCRTVDLEGQS